MLHSLLQERIPFINWENFLFRGFQIVDHQLDPSVTILVDQDYLQVTGPHLTLPALVTCDTVVTVVIRAANVQSATFSISWKAFSWSKAPV